MVSIQYLFDVWKAYITKIRYERFQEIYDEERAENEYARKNNMDPIYWCWNCKHGDCDQHSVTYSDYDSDSCEYVGGVRFSKFDEYDF